MLRALALSLGLHAAAAAAYGGYRLAGLAEAPPRPELGGSAWITISLHGEPGAQGAAGTAPTAGSTAAVGSVGSVESAQSAEAAEPALAPPARASDATDPRALIAAAAPVIEQLVTGVGHAVEDVYEAALESPSAPAAPRELVAAKQDEVSAARDASTSEADDGDGADAAGAADAADETGAAVAAVASGDGGSGDPSDGSRAAGADASSGSDAGSGSGAPAAASDGSGTGPGEGSGGEQSGAGMRGPGLGERTLPAYPPAARRAGQEGVVIVLALSAASGAVEQVSIAQSSGFPLLDEAALAAVREWTFVPALEHGVAVAGYVRVPIRFRLQR